MPLIASARAPVPAGFVTHQAWRHALRNPMLRDAVPESIPREPARPSFSRPVF